MSILVFILVVLVLVGLAIYALNQFAPIDGAIKNLIAVVIVLIGIIAIAQRAGLF